MAKMLAKCAAADLNLIRIHVATYSSASYRAQGSSAEKQQEADTVFTAAMAAALVTARNASMYAALNGYRLADDWQQCSTSADIAQEHPDWCQHCTAEQSQARVYSAGICS
jgi:hypothetical protein